MNDLVSRLRTALRTAMLQRDRDAVSALRSALAAIENAEAVDTEGGGLAVEDAPLGVGVTDVARRTLDVAEVEAVVAAEAEEYESGANYYEELGRSDEAEALRAKARVLRDQLSGI